MMQFLENSGRYLPLLLQGVGITIALTLAALVISTLLGLAWALMRYSGIAPLVFVSKAIVNTVRGIPILVQLFYIYFVLPEFGIDLSAFQAGALGLGLAYSCYMAENFRAGLEAIDKGQIEAAQSIGMK
ncbi:MAG: amino acid ABC transporter permease, partial [Neoaquamicrobium sediminum]|uniref:amino acid ABC transporter permease n=1 Tax=Neoaquamicrobium sediminum TaxID=1849104 RepID=UPI004037FBFD